METKQIEVPEALLTLLTKSRLRELPQSEQVRTALAVHLFLEGLVSIGKAAELAGEDRASFEWLLAEMGMPTVWYDRADYEQDQRGMSGAERHQVQ